MAFLTIQINASDIAVGSLNEVLDAGDSTKPQEILNNIKNLIDSIQAGSNHAVITAVSSTVAGTVSGQTGGVSASLNLA